jgi:3'-phosphoadenosine 5'-phosphosulfate sulfotransferase (PAPS reductase)/FAD synthetase
MKKLLTHLDWLESEAIHIMREVAGQCSNPVLLFSGGKDSTYAIHVAKKQGHDVVCLLSIFPKSDEKLVGVMPPMGILAS